jgi:hypothetical protein
VEVVFPTPPFWLARAMTAATHTPSLNLEVSSTTCGETLPAVLNSL